MTQGQEPQGPRVKEQDPRTMQGTEDSACMGRARGQEPRTKEQESQGPRTNDHAGAKDHVGVEMIYRKNELCMHDTDQTNKGPRPTCRDPHAWRAILYPRIEFILLAIYFSTRHQALIIYMSSRSEEKNPASKEREQTYFAISE